MISYYCVFFIYFVYRLYFNFMLTINNCYQHYRFSYMSNKDYQNPEIITTSDKTKQDYLKKVEQLIKKIKRENNVDIVDERLLVAWLLNHRENINKNTFRYYKSAILYYLTDIIATDIAIESANHLNKFTSEMSYKKSNKTSAKKSKKINQEDLIKIFDYMDKNESKWNVYVKNWLIAGILCGLRPSEWINSELILNNETNVYSLYVKNAKNSNGRANGDFRTIVLTDVTEDEINIIRQHMYDIKNFSNLSHDGFEKFYKDCSARLNYINKQVFTRRTKNITLYSARHQFSANAKHSGLKTTEIAALMGHAVDETATQHYGRKNYGNSKLKVKPVQSQVDTVKITSSNNKFIHESHDIKQEQTQSNDNPFKFDLPKLEPKSS